LAPLKVHHAAVIFLERAHLVKSAGKRSGTLHRAFKLLA
jgi:hypothetical protein